MIDSIMTEPGYPAARAVATKVQAHFARHFGLQVAVLDPPVSQDIEAIVDAVFWASLKREEGYVPKVSIALVPPEHAGQPLLFSRRLPLSATTLTKVAPAIERPGIHLGVWPQDGELRVWGTTRVIPAF